MLADGSGEVGAFEGFDYPVARLCLRQSVLSVGRNSGPKIELSLGSNYNVALL